MTPAQADPVILTVRLDQASQALFDDQRRRYFPPSRNLLSAHVTLFHNLPGMHAADIVGLVGERCRMRGPAPVAVRGLRSLGRGVAYVLDMPEVAALRQELARAWSDWLTPQDRQKWSPHVTVQNKADPEEARRCLDSLGGAFSPFSAVAEGIDAWWYRGGPWDPLARHSFANSFR